MLIDLFFQKLIALESEANFLNFFRIYSIALSRILVICLTISGISHLNLIIPFSIVVMPAVRNQWVSLREPAMAVKS